jgi:hypothetical protein
VAGVHRTVEITGFNSQEPAENPPRLLSDPQS